MEFITAELTPWHWLTLGVLFFALELFGPTTILLWPAVAAIATGIIVLLVPVLSWQLQLALFAVLAIATTLIVRVFIRKKSQPPSDYPALNRRGDSVKGRLITLQKPIVNGVGGEMIDNTWWRLVGPDMPAGSTLLITGTEGSSLTVEPKEG